MDIITEDYSITYDAETATIHWQGIMRLNTKDYKPIAQLLDNVVALEPSKITLNLRELNMLNSSGITLLGRFFLNAGKKKNIPLVIQTEPKIPWQKNSLKKFQKLIPKLQFE